MYKLEIKRGCKQYFTIMEQTFHTGGYTHVLLIIHARYVHINRMMTIKWRLNFVQAMQYGGTTCTTEKLLRSIRIHYCKYCNLIG